MDWAYKLAVVKSAIEYGDPYRLMAVQQGVWGGQSAEHWVARARFDGWLFERYPTPYGKLQYERSGIGGLDVEGKTLYFPQISLERWFWGKYKELEESSFPTLAITVQQPWAYLLANGNSNVLNLRNGITNESYHGELWLHAAADIAAMDDGQCHEWLKRIGESGTQLPPYRVFQAWRDEYPNIQTQVKRGGIIGRFNVIRALERGKKEFKWHDEFRLGLLIEDMELVPFVPCRGTRGLWKVGPGTLLELSTNQKQENKT